MNIRCPKCDSENVQSVRVICESGTSRGKSSSRILGLASDGEDVLLGGARTSSKITTVTDLAARLAKPKKMDVLPVWILWPIPWFLVTLVAFMVIDPGAKENPIAWFLLTLGLIGLVPTIIYAVRNYRKASTYNNYILPRMIQDWNESFFCHKCGQVFRVGATRSLDPYGVGSPVIL